MFVLCRYNSQIEKATTDNILTHVETGIINGKIKICSSAHSLVTLLYGLVVSAPAWDGTGREFDSWQCRIYIPCSLSLRLLGSLRGSLGTYGLTQKLC